MKPVVINLTFSQGFLFQSGKLIGKTNKLTEIESYIMLKHSFYYLMMGTQLVKITNKNK